VLTGESKSGQQLTPPTLSVAWRLARTRVTGLPEGFRFHDLRHFYASLLIASGADVKVVQSGLRHSSAVTTLDVYGTCSRIRMNRLGRCGGGVQIVRTVCGAEPMNVDVYAGQAL
jgi:integrase